MAYGAGASNTSITSYASQFFSYLHTNFPHPKHVLHNGAIPGSRPAYVGMCHDWHVPRNADLVVVRPHSHTDPLLTILQTSSSRSESTLSAMCTLIFAQDLRPLRHVCNCIHIRI